MTLQDEIARWLGDYLVKAGANGFVLGLSGGVDSATAAGLAAKATGPESVLAAILPCHSQPIDARLAHQVADTFSIPTVTVNLDAAFEALIEDLPPSGHRLAAANIKPRLRMTALYYLAQMHGCLVLGSGNKTELMVGYSTKYGDSGVDLLPLGDVYKTEVRELAGALGVPQEVIDRPPSAGLWPGQTDEEELGITYRELDRVLIAMEDGATNHITPAKLRKVQRLVANSAHKRSTPPIFGRT
jgi:NAD+ synthase